jgi:hypothetical protein
MIELPIKLWLCIAALVTAISVALWAIGLIPWWGILIAVPVATLVAVAALLLFGIIAWMAGGSH